jgi:lipase
LRGQSLHVQEWGDRDGPPVVCLHGLSGHGGRFVRLAERLRAFRVVAVDLRGHGTSTWAPPWDAGRHVADLLDTLEALGIDRAAWVGHSFGGRLIAELATASPDQLERAVLLDPAMHIEPSIAAERADLLLVDVAFDDADEAVEARLADGSLFTTPREILEEEAASHLTAAADGRFRWRFSRAAAIAAWSEMARPAPPFPTCPTLVVLGERSWIPVDLPETPSLEVATVPGGHSVLWDDFAATSEAVAAFLAA